MSESLQDVKNRLRSRFLGKSGIHGIGFSRAENSIRVYVTRRRVVDSSTVLAQIEKESAPYGVIVIEEAPPSIQR